jgi:hypothetical protein
VETSPRAHGFKNCGNVITILLGSVTYRPVDALAANTEEACT